MIGALIGLLAPVLTLQAIKLAPEVPIVASLVSLIPTGTGPYWERPPSYYARDFMLDVYPGPLCGVLGLLLVWRPRPNSAQQPPGARGSM